jgi:hypothetical protein
LGAAGVGLVSKVSTAIQLGRSSTTRLGAIGEEAIGAPPIKEAIRAGSRYAYPDRITNGVIQEAKNVSVIGSRDAAQIARYTRATNEPVEVFTRRNSDVSAIRNLIDEGLVVQRFLPGVNNSGVWALTTQEAVRVGAGVGAAKSVFSPALAK